MIKQRRSIYIVICCFIIFIISGCEPSDVSSDYTHNVTITPTIIPESNSITTPTVIPTITSSVVNDDKANSEGLDDLTDFKNLSNYFIDYIFQLKNNGTEKLPHSFSVNGKYDLNNDGVEDNIQLLLKGRAENQSYIEVNDIKKIFSIDNTYTGEVRIVDLDQNDNYLEVACYDDGLSGDPIYIFFRYDGEQLYEIGSIDAYANIDGHGKLISIFNMSWQFTPSFCSAWYEIENNTLVKKNNAIDKYLGLTYDFMGGNSYFIPFDKIPEKIKIKWDETRYFTASKVKINSILYMDSLERTLNYYFVEFPSGEKGLLYFWIGD